MRKTDDVGGDEEGWVVPEPADEVIVAEIVDRSDLSRGEVEPLSDHVDFERLHDLLASTTTEPADLTFSIEGIEVVITADGTVTVST
jgi:hypothetical protein